MMKINNFKLSEQRDAYDAPGILAIDFITDGILCSSSSNRTESLEEDSFDPWV